MGAPQILYKLSWTAADGAEHTLHGVHAAVSAAQAALVDAGATSIAIGIPEVGQGRRRKPRLDEPLWGEQAERVHDELDANE